MEDLQTVSDTLSGYDKNQEDLDSTRTHEEGCAALLNGSDEVDDPLDLMDNCDNESLGSNSDVWKGSDSEDDNFEGKANAGSKDVGTNKENEKKTDNPANKKENIDKTDIAEDKDSGVEKSSEDLKTQSNVEKSLVENKETIEAEEAGNASVNTDNEKKDFVENAVAASDVDKKKCPQFNEQKADNTTESSDGKETRKDATAAELSDGKEVEKHADIAAENVPTEIDAQKEIPTENTEIEKNDSAKQIPKEPNEAKPSEVTKQAAQPDKATDKDPLSIDLTNQESENKDPLAADADQESSETRPNRYNEGVDDECQMDYDAEDDDDFDPSLLCPEVSMAVDDNPVVTTNGNMPNDGCDSPLPYEPVFSTFVDEVTGAEISFNLTSEEQELRRRLYGPTNPIQIARIHCTACNVHLGSALEGQNNRFVHPLLKVIICKECYHFYTSGEFEKDEDGSELYCRWCGQGGQVLCCSKCEYVFCKRCIRTNFGRKKMFEIRDSASWDCFRCNLQQIITQRIACYEFFEYVRREMQRAATLNSPEVWSKDHTRCCNQKKRSLESWEDTISRVKKPKKRKSETDPDYDPLVDKPVVVPPLATSTPASTSNVQNIGMQRVSMMSKPGVHIVPRMNKPKDNDIEFVRQIPAPHVTIGAAPRPTYRTILPTNVRPAFHQPTLLRISAQPVPPLVPTSNRMLNSALQGRNVNTSNMMKHEWFEKTVRAAARVNSHLSYTLTQLNKAQSQAASVEELAVVHNKLQEILSSSINSLIQIRKNLRTEFITGIKTVRLPSKKVDQTFNNDDDVIFVSTPTPPPLVPPTPLPSTSTVSAPTKDPLVIIDHSTPTKIHGVTVRSVGSTPKPKGGYLKVKSVMELQNVPSECITIPDDSPSKCNGTSDTTKPNKEVDPLAGTPGTGNASKDAVVTATIDLSEVPNDPISRNIKRKSDESHNEESAPPSKITKLVYNTKDKPTIDVKKMMAVKVKVQNENLEELQKKLTKKSN